MKTYLQNLLVTMVLFLIITITMVADPHNAIGSEKQPKPVSPWSLSYKLEAKKNYKQAEKAITYYIKDIKTRELAVMRIAWLAYLQGDYNKAIKGYNQALDINPQSINAKLGLTLPLIAQKRWRETRNELNALLKISPWNYTAHQRLLVIDEAEAKWKSMTNHAKTLSKKFPNDPTALVYLARGYAWQKKPKEAIDAYNKVLLLVPGHYEATYYIKKHSKNNDG
ncbi:MAG: tetratricopeptide repeat protein [Magnetococcales bacterium]|nr:tetratricopeptide repeat protein [Magnetococcales bacterium]